MKWMSNFLKLRRQYGSVKIATLLFVLALYFIVQSIISIMNYAEFASGSVEYIITISNPDGVQNSDFVNLQELDYVNSISRQRIYNIAYVSGTETKPLSVTEVYADYLQGAYGVNQNTPGTCFYLNEKAWEEIVTDGTEEAIHLSYSVDETTWKTALFIPVDGLKNDSPMAFTVGNSVSLAECMAIRMRTDKIDITGKTLEKIQALGYTVGNEQEILEGMRELEVVMLKVKYGMIITGLSLVLGYVLVKHKNGNHII